MININWVERYCKNYEQIENYQEAVSSPEKWDCHHRNEIDMNLSKKELKERGLYYNCPASELIFLTHGAHTSLHHKEKVVSNETRKRISDAHRGENSYMYGKHHSTETKKKMSDALKGNKNPNYKNICPALLHMLYIEQGKSAYKIAQELGIARGVIIRRLKELNIPIRKR